VNTSDVARLGADFRKPSPTGKPRLNPDTVANLFLICHYTVALAFGR
jgi:hypothetical protein